MVNKRHCFSLFARARVALLALIVAAGMLGAPTLAHARESSDSEKATSAVPAGKSTLDSDRYYINKDGKLVHSPAKSRTGHPPAGATAQCRDGTYSFSLHHRGTCSHHGGVSHWL